MLKQHARAVDAALRLADLILLTVALPIAYFVYLRIGPRPYALGIERLWFPLVLALLVWVAASWGSDLYGTYRTKSMWTEIGRLTRSLALVALMFAASLFALKEIYVSRLLVALYLGTSFALLAGTRAVMRLLARALRRRGYNTRRYAIVGTGPLAEDIAETFAANASWGFQLAGYILPAEGPTHAPPGRVLGTLAGLEGILDEHVLDEIVFAVPRTDLTSIEKSVLLCEEQGVAVVMCLEPLRVGKADMSLFELSDRPMLVLSRTPTDVIALFAKRAFDIAVSAAVLLVLAPVFAALAIAIRVESPGPVFFRQRRVGRSGRPFTMLKFRSMYRDAEQRLEALKAMNEMSGPVFKMKNDPRVTRMGKLLRKTSLDELPQFWNVFKGEMSVVGPRPPIPAEVKQYKRWQRRRLSVKPGITCTWQVSGRNNIDFDRWMELDLEYIDNWSLWRDVQICFKTVPAVLTTRGAR